MVWYEIVVALLGAFGGLAGVAAFIKSFWMLKPEKNSKEISNEHAEIANLREFISIANENYDRLKTEFKQNTIRYCGYNNLLELNLGKFAI